MMESRRPTLPARYPSFPPVRQSSTEGERVPMPKQRILTGTRPTGSLHLGHYAGALEKLGGACKTNTSAFS